MHVSRYRTRAIVAQVALLIYFELCVLVPLGRWNEQAGGHEANFALAVAIGIAQTLLLIGTVWRLRPLLWLGLAGDSIWLVLHMQSFWIPYIFGASPQWAKMYSRVFSNSTKLLPNFGNHLAPDAMHIFIDVFVMAVLVTLVALLRAMRTHKLAASGFAPIK